MDPFHANYPFLDSSREAVREADIGLAEIITADRGGETRHPAVERGVQRVERALLDGTIDVPDDGSHPGVQAELLSYPVARVLVSVLDVPGAVDKYASAEARTAYQRFTDDFELLDGDQRRPDDGKVPLRYFLSEFDLSSRVTPRGSGFSIAVSAYLTLSSEFESETWRLVNRELADGAVTVTRDELHELLREAVRERVAEGLPTRVPDEIREGLTDEMAELEDAFSEVEFSRDIDVLAPGQFPPCVADLLERARDGEALPARAEFALVSFLASIGADPDEMVALRGVDDPEEATALRYRADRVGDDAGAQYAPPSCATMQAYGECPVADETAPIADPRCETISHPLSYYEEALAEADGVDDWRE
ncbi:DNA primase large subunit PriL [Halorussus salilacus]|uniref:DNA primase large subunit PriL n=1 Tax=Halorussus salilacus TaxID=2953750 RepID=UPI0020A1CDC1|nr:DNA primase large subunit PriL [Halorussus salilacus]USZ67133.1 DNA primase large subunit PriL [Halorussus salilacus]